MTMGSGVGVVYFTAPHWQEPSMLDVRVDSRSMDFEVRRYSETGSKGVGIGCKVTTTRN